MQSIVEFANITGWRTPSEILPLEWWQVDIKTGETTDRRHRSFLCKPENLLVRVERLRQQAEALHVRQAKRRGHHAR